MKIAGPRYEHTIRVADTAEKLAVKYGEDVEKTVLAAIFHDYAKLLPINELKKSLPITSLIPAYWTTIPNCGMALQELYLSVKK